MRMGWKFRLISLLTRKFCGSSLSRARFGFVSLLFWLLYFSSRFCFCFLREVVHYSELFLLINHSNGLNMRPEPFKCSIEPRSEEIRQTIEREARQAEDDLSVYDGESKYRMSEFYKVQREKVV